jgi:lactoylglutathione lyase
MLRLAKNHIDIGLFTNNIELHHVFWTTSVGLRLDHELKLFKGITQHRYDAHDSVIKVNHNSNLLEDQPRSGYTHLKIASDIFSAQTLKHPGGDYVSLVKPGTNRIVGIGVEVSTMDPRNMMDFYTEVMGFEHVTKNTVRCGDSLIFVTKGQPGTQTESFIGPNFRYLTVQIYDADLECAAIEEKGGLISQPPRTIGEIARYGFVTDPDGNWIEISARASLTGIIPTPDS